MASKVGQLGRTTLQALARSLGIEDVKYAPNALDTDDIKVVAALPAPLEYQQFTTSVNALTAGGVAGVDLDTFAVGGVAENGQSAAQQVNSTNNAPGSANDPGGSLATDWDYLIISAAVEIQLTAAQATAEAGNDIEVSWIQYVPLITPDQGAAGSMLSAGFMPITRINIGDGMTIDADQLTYTFPIFFNQSDAQDAATTWRGWIPGIEDSGLRATVQKRTGSAGAIAAWGSAVQHRSRVYGLRFRKGMRIAL